MLYHVAVKPNSRKGPLVIEDGNNLTVYLHEKPIDGEANAALIKVLSKHFHIAKTRISIKSGTRGREKLLEII